MDLYITKKNIININLYFTSNLMIAGLVKDKEARTRFIFQITDVTRGTESNL